MSIMPPGSESKDNTPDHLPPPMRELADGIAQYVESFVFEATDHEPPAIDWQYMAEDFVESCVIDIMRIGGGPMCLGCGHATRDHVDPGGCCIGDCPCLAVRG